MNHFTQKIMLSILVTIILSVQAFAQQKNNKLTLPYAQAGLTTQQAAAHILGRFTFGASQKNIDDAVNMGINKWLMLQLMGTLPDADLQEKLDNYPALKLSNTEIAAKYLDGNTIKKLALAEGVITEEQLKTTDKAELRKLYKDYLQKNNLQPEVSLYNQLFARKVLSAIYSNNQLHQVLTDFWYNHFNVSLTKNSCRQYIPNYERLAIQPFVVGNFADMLIATAKNPAMLLYLDNATSTGDNEASNLLQQKIVQRMQRRQNNTDTTNLNANAKIRKPKPKGLNENYAREVMELHTLGVDGGYTQTDVTEAARVLTGWTIYPVREAGAINKMLSKIGKDQLEARNFVHEGDFLFTPNRHDDKPKTVLGVTYNQGGYDEGIALLTNLATNKATANFICKKLATRFVSDAPPQSLILAMATTFTNTKGNIKEVILTMVQSPEFWSADAVRQKTKSPFEYAISSLRALNAEVTMPAQINNWVTRMGQKLYYYQAPTGYPDNAQYWINTGSLLNRMNFGLALAGKRIPGVTFDLAALNNNHEPESSNAALQSYATILLPQRNIQPTVTRLTPLLDATILQDKLTNATANTNTATPTIMQTEPDETMVSETIIMRKEKIKQHIKKQEPITLTFGDNSMLAQVVGIIIGSPEFQRK